LEHHLDAAPALPQPLAAHLRDVLVALLAVMEDDLATTRTARD